MKVGRERVEMDRRKAERRLQELCVKMVDDGDTEMISEKSDTEEGDIAEASTTLEKAATDRKRRLMNMKAQMQNDGWLT
uniref:Uncharacterized protein n=1 Tax=Parascaris equorum TaxID=6256 RepID=A0A914RTW7_PAREQ